MQQQVCDFLHAYLNYKTYPHIFKACHPLGTWNEGHVPPSIIVNFINLKEKNETFGTKSWLSRCNKKTNQRSILIKERLPKKQKKLIDEADKLGLVASSYNCNVKIFMKSDHNTFKSVVVKSKKLLTMYRSRPLRKNSNSGTL